MSSDVDTVDYTVELALCANLTLEHNGTDLNISKLCPGNASQDYESEFDWNYVHNIEIPRLLAEFTFPKAHEWALISAYVVVFILALAGNILVIFAVLRNPQMRTVTNYYIINLSVADILVSIICMPITVVMDTTETWYFGYVACKAIPYFQVVSMSVSVFTLSAIAIDRYFAICRPLLFKTTAKRALSIILLIWAVSFLIPAPQAVVYQTERPLERFIYLTKCYEKSWQGTVEQKVYHIILVCVGYVIPLSMVTVAYTLVCKQLWSSIPGTFESRNDGKSTKENDVINKSTENQLLSRRKVAKMLIVVVIIFAICYLPLHVLNILRQFPDVFMQFEYDLSQRDVFHVPFFVAHWFAYANSATNPIIYNFLSAKFRREFRAAFQQCCGCCKRRRRPRRRRPGYRTSLFNSSTHSKSYNMYTTTEHISMSVLRRSSDKVRM
ncbi:orexin/Hypocretin receptor type 1-like [Ptychodera flava]|uniref:orexin/Hypocretin receptor type 1-like n=1 Tax=Ptychodera flava TaxID=63121 RepID=UPI003969EDD5